MKQLLGSSQQAARCKSKVLRACAKGRSSSLAFRSSSLAYSDDDEDDDDLIAANLLPPASSPAHRDLNAEIEAEPAEDPDAGRLKLKRPSAELLKSKFIKWEIPCELQCATRLCGKSSLTLCSARRGPAAGSRAHQAGVREQEVAVGYYGRGNRVVLALQRRVGKVGVWVRCLFASSSFARR